MDTSCQGSQAARFLLGAVFAQLHTGCGQYAAHDKDGRRSLAGEAYQRVMCGVLRVDEKPDTEPCLPANSVSGLEQSGALCALGRSAFQYSTSGGK